jgi:hypothetical protein
MFCHMLVEGLIGFDIHLYLYIYLYCSVFSVRESLRKCKGGRGFIHDELQRRITVELPGACGGQRSSFRSEKVDSVIKNYLFLVQPK